MSSLRRPFFYDRDPFVTMAFLAVILAIPQAGFAWSREGHQLIVILAAIGLATAAGFRARRGWVNAPLRFFPGTRDPERCRG